jgi:hypothetical protein
MPSAPDAADLALHNLATQRAIALVSALPPLQAEVIMLRVVAGLDTEAVAELLGRGQGGCPPRPSAACRNPGQRGCNAMTDPGVPHDDMLSFLWRSRMDIPQIGDEALDALLAATVGGGGKVAAYCASAPRPGAGAHGKSASHATGRATSRPGHTPAGKHKGKAASR